MELSCREFFVTQIISTSGIVEKYVVHAYQMEKVHIL